MTTVAERPGPGPARPYRFPTVERRDGVVAADMPGRPLAVAVLLLDAGAGREPVDHAGVVGVLAEALEEGTATRDAADFALALEGLGARLFTAVDWDSCGIGIEAPVDQLSDAVALIAEAVRTPRLDPADVARVRDDEATALRMAWARPGPRADAALRSALFGVDVRYGRPLRGDPAGVARLSVDDVVDFHGAWFAQRGTLVVAGDLDRLDLAVLGEAAFSRADAPGADDRGPLPAVDRDGRHIVLVDRPGSVQSTLRLGHTAPPRSHPDHVPMTLAATVLGGAFTSRLNHLIREVRGYTYGIRSEFGQSRRAGRFVVRTGVQTAVTAAALDDTVGEIARLQADGATAEEVAVAAVWRAGTLSVDLQTPGAIARALTTVVVHGLPDDHYEALHAELHSADVEAVSAAAAEHLRPDALVLVVEGDAASIRDDLAATGLGEVVDAPR